MRNTERVPSTLINQTRSSRSKCDLLGVTRKLSAMYCVTESPAFGQSILLCSLAEKAVCYLNLRVVLPARWELGGSQGGLPLCSCVLFLSFIICMYMYQTARGCCVKVKNKTKTPKWTPALTCIFSLSCWLSSKMQLKRRCPGSRNGERLYSGLASFSF